MVQFGAAESYRRLAFWRQVLELGAPACHGDHEVVVMASVRGGLFRRMGQRLLRLLAILAAIIL